MRQRELLAAIAGIDPIRVRGTFERHTSLRWEELEPCFTGNLSAEQWPKVTKRDVWRGLPPDHRRLRLVGEALGALA